MSLFQEFRTFIQKGNVVDLAVAVIIGGAFGKIVSSVVADVIMPPIGLLVGGVNFTSLKLAIGGTAEAQVTLNYGNFLQATFDFLIVAIAVFAMVKTVNSMKKKEEAPAAAPAPPEDVVLLREIRDLLKQGKC
jgi:large conductance mechanosensitive channel